MDRSKKQLISFIGSALATAGIVFVSLKILDYGAHSDFFSLDRQQIFALVGLAFVCGLSNVILVLAWTNVLSFFGVSGSFWQSFKIYGLSQIAKYVPGNVFHLASRQALGAAAGSSGGSLVKAAILELVLISTAATVLSVLLLPIFFNRFPTLYSGLVLAGLLILVATLLTRYLNVKIVNAFVCYICFLSVLGTLFLSVLMLLTNDLLLSASKGTILSSAFVFAWLVGFLTPGAPAGLGVREFMLLMLLENVVSETELLRAVLYCRIITAFGDIIFFVAALVLKFKRHV